LPHLQHVHYYSTSFFSLLLPPPPTSSLFPYTTLFRSPLLDFYKRADRGPVADITTVEVDEGIHSDIATELYIGCDIRVYAFVNLDRKSTRLNSSHVKISYAVFCLKKKKKK